MKNILIILVLIAHCSIIFSQGNELPSVDLKTIDGKIFNSKNISNDGKPIIISFWATWCKPCVKELNAIADEYEDWQEETGVKLIAVSVDDTRSMSRVKPFVNGKGWEYEILLDPNGDFKRAMNIVNVPHTFIIDGKGNIVWKHASYSDGDEEKLYELVKKVSKGESIE